MTTEPGHEETTRRLAGPPPPAASRFGPSLLLLHAPGLAVALPLAFTDFFHVANDADHQGPMADVRHLDDVALAQLPDGDHQPFAPVAPVALALADADLVGTAARLA